MCLESKWMIKQVKKPDTWHSAQNQCFCQLLAATIDHDQNSNNNSNKFKSIQNMEIIPLKLWEKKTPKWWTLIHKKSAFGFTNRESTERFLYARFMYSCEYYKIKHLLHCCWNCSSIFKFWIILTRKNRSVILIYI